MRRQSIILYQGLHSCLALGLLLRRSRKPAACILTVTEEEGSEVSTRPRAWEVLLSCGGRDPSVFCFSCVLHSTELRSIPGIWEHLKPATSESACGVQCHFPPCQLQSLSGSYTSHKSGHPVMINLSHNEQENGGCLKQPRKKSE